MTDINIWFRVNGSLGLKNKIHHHAIPCYLTKLKNSIFSKFVLKLDYVKRAFETYEFPDLQAILL